MTKIAPIVALLLASQVAAWNRAEAVSIEDVRIHGCFDLGNLKIVSVNP